jgi:hypothetical protein
MNNQLKDDIKLEIAKFRFHLLIINRNMNKNKSTKIIAFQKNINERKVNIL